MSPEARSVMPHAESLVPPLPDAIPSAPQASAEPLPLQPPQPLPLPPIALRSLRCGGYLINYTPSNSLFVSYDGMLRVECHSGGRTASGDLYQRPLIFLPPLPGFPPILRPPVLGPAPNPAAGITTLPRSRYRYYLRVTQILEFFTLGKSFTLGFEMYRFNSATRTWTNEGTFTALMTWTPAPAGYPSSNDYLTGEVKNSSGTVVGKLTMGWVSKYLRKATVEIDCVPGSEAPVHNGEGIDWKDIFDEVGWDVTVDVSDPNVAPPSGASWSDAELHQAMLARRDASNLDAEWRYHILAVHFLDSTSRGIMYDAFGTDSNNVPREGVGISSHWMIPNTSTWGLVKGQRFGVATKPYYRTAVHELGHAMGLYHNTVDNGFMNTTDVIAAAATPATPFPNNIKWSFAADDQRRLRHFPDIYVRPGGTPFGTSYATTPLSPVDMAVDVTGLELHVSALLAVVPLGAPVRVHVDLVNSSGEPILAPASLQMKTGFVRGSVIDPAGTGRTFSPLVLCIEEHPLDALEHGKHLSQSLTLLRGGEGALFPMPGMHRVIVEVHWDVGGVEYRVVGETSVMVTAAVDDAHAQAALKVLSTPDTLLTLVLGGDHIEDGIEAMRTALNNPVLRPHFAYIEAKRLAEGFGQRKGNLKAAAALIDDSTVMSPAEIKKAATLVKAEKRDSEGAKSLAKTLKSKAHVLNGDADIREMLATL